jgi:hypothetical protein
VKRVARDGATSRIADRRRKSSRAANSPYRFRVKVESGCPPRAGTSPSAPSDRAVVDAFYEAATAAGGQEDGPSGVREHYHPSYYAAYVYDADRNNIEAVCHAPV